MTKVTVIDGGTGSFTVLSGLKRYPIDLTAVVCVTDSGGSTGRLRDEFGYLPVGDFRMALVALSAEETSGDLLRKLFMYRFSKGEGLKGHNFGNLWLTALNELLSSQEKALTATAKLLNIKGRVVPISNQESTLVAEYNDGSTLIGEDIIDNPPETHNTNLRITKLSTKPKVRLNKNAADAISTADFIILGPGDLYTSLFANLIVENTKETLIKSSAKKIFVINLVTKAGQTLGFKASDFIKEYKRYTDTLPDFVLLNNKNLPKAIVKRYKEKQEFPVEDDLAPSDTINKKTHIIRADLLAENEIIKPSGDVLRRSLLRHDPDKLAKTLLKVFLS